MKQIVAQDNRRACEVNRSENEPGIHILAAARTLIAMAIALSACAHSAERVSAQCLPSFNPPTNWSAGAQPIAVAVADFNNDGNDDLAVANNQGNTVTIRRGNGNGTFQAGVSYSVGGSGSTALAVADFDGDGKLDLAVTNSESGTVAVLRGNGIGGFLAAISYAVGNWPTSVATGDLDGNGSIDLAVVNYGSGSISVLLGFGNGTFQLPMTYEYIGAKSVELSDINGDGKLDIVAASRDGGSYSSVMVRRGNGNGTFQSPLTYNPGNSYIESIAVVDVTGDGKPDVITASAYVNGLDLGGKAYVLKNNGTGSLLAPVAYTVANGVAQVVVHEMNGDGIPDLLSVSPTSNSVSILLGNGNGTFQSFLPFGVGSSPASLAIGDFNKDSNPDLAVANNGANSVAVAINSALVTPVITAQPLSRVVFDDFPANLSVSATGQGPLTYQWLRDGSPIVDGDGISGSLTPILAFTLINPGDAGSYECVIANACGDVSSHPAMLTVIPQCTGDFNMDGRFDGLDVQLLVDALLDGQTCP